jgi:hypothetical protein
MVLPVTVESAARDAIASLHQLLSDRLSTVAPVREQHGKYPFWQWYLFGRPCRGVAGRGVYRYLADEPDPTGQHW